MKNIRKVLIGLVFIFVAVFLVACDDEQKNEGELVDFSELYGRKETIVVWMDDEKGDYQRALISEFNKIHPDIVVQFRHMGTVDSREKLKVFGPSGHGADVFMFPHDHLAPAILEDLVLSLPESTRTLINERSHSLGAQITTMHYNPANKSFDPNDPGAVPTLFAVPISIESIGLYYNKELIDEPAETFEQILEEAEVWKNQKVSETDTRTNGEAGRYYLATSSHWADSYFMQPFYSALGFYPFGEELNNPEAVGFVNAIDTLTFFQEELKPLVTGTGNHDSVGATHFISKRIPYVIAGPWNIEQYRDEAEIDFGIAQMPTLNGQPTKTFAGAQMVAVYKYSKNQDAAIKWVEFLLSDVAMKLQYDLKYKLPALKSELLAGVEGVTDDEALMAMSAQLETSIPMPTIPEVASYWGPGEAMIKAVWNEGKSPEDAATEAEQNYRTLLGLKE